VAVLVVSFAGKLLMGLWIPAVKRKPLIFCFFCIKAKEDEKVKGKNVTVGFAAS